MKNLHTRLDEIDKIPPTIEIDKPKEYLKVFEEYYHLNPLVARVVKGETSFSEEFRSLRESIDATNLWWHSYGHDKRFERFSDLLKLVTYSDQEIRQVSGDVRMCMSEGVSGGLTIGGLTELIVNSGKKSSRREVLKLFTGMGLGAVVGSLGGAFFSLERYFKIEDIQKKSAYLDEKVGVAYNKK